MSDLTSNSCYVYVIQAASGAVKIGIAANVQSRLSDLQSANHEKLTVVHTLGFATRRVAQAVEQAMHESYAPYSIRGEWFTVNAERVIEDMKFALEIGNAVRGYSVEFAPKPRPKPKAPAPKQVIQLSAAQLDEVAKWAIRRGSLSFSALINTFQYDHPTANAILYTFNRYGCLLPIEGVEGEYQYDPHWQSRQGVQA